jgi:hypothetical protein
MKAIKKNKVTVHLIMNQVEADWLVGIMQNPIVHACESEDEDDLDAKMRKSFWKKLRPLLT